MQIETADSEVTEGWKIGNQDIEHRIFNSSIFFSQEQ